MKANGPDVISADIEIMSEHIDVLLNLNGGLKILFLYYLLKSSFSLLDLKLFMGCVLCSRG